MFFRKMSSSVHRERDRERDRDTRSRTPSPHRVHHVSFCADYLIGDGCNGLCESSHASSADLDAYVNAPTHNKVCKYGSHCYNAKYPVLCSFEHRADPNNGARIIRVLRKKQERIDSLRRHNDDVELELRNTNNRLDAARVRIAELETQQRTYQQESAQMNDLIAAAIAEKQRDDVRTNALIAQYQLDEANHRAQLTDMQQRVTILSGLLQLHQRRAAGEKI